MYRMKREGKGHEPKVDSTRGEAFVDPRTFKGDVLVQVWVDSRVIATLSEWIDNTGNSTRYMSEVVKGILNAVLVQVVESGEVEMIEWSDDARELLEKKYRVNLNPGGRGMRNVIHNQVLTDRIRRSDIEAGLTVNSKVVEPGRVRAMETYNELYGDEAKRLKKKDEDRLNALKEMDG